MQNCALAVESASSPARTPAADALRSHLKEIFERNDFDQNGRLNAIEFREAMKEVDLGALSASMGPVL